MKKIVFIIFAALLTVQAYAASCTKDNVGERSCQAGRLMECKQQGYGSTTYKWEKTPLSPQNQQLANSGYPVSDCNDSSHNEAGSNGKNK